MSAVRQGAGGLGYGHRDIVSGAAPTGMIFVPCKDGISHNEIESAHGRSDNTGQKGTKGGLLPLSSIFSRYYR